MRAPADARADSFSLPAMPCFIVAKFIASLAALIILIPMIVEVGRVHAMDAVHLGMLAVLATQIGAATPPVAVGLFVAASIAGATCDRTIRYCLPSIVALLATLLIVFFFPATATWLPRVFHASFPATQTREPLS